MPYLEPIININRMKFRGFTTIDIPSQMFERVLNTPPGTMNILSHTCRPKKPSKHAEHCITSKHLKHVWTYRDFRCLSKEKSQRPKTFPLKLHYRYMIGSYIHP